MALAWVASIPVVWGCSTPEPTPADVVPFASVCDAANEGQRVGVRGYLRLPQSNTGDFSIVLRLYETAELTGDPIGVSVRFGDGPNQASTLPSSYTDDDLELRSADAETVGYAEPVTISGEMYYPMVDQDFRCGLNTVYVVKG